MVPKSKLERLVPGENHQGVVLAVAAYHYATIDDLFDNAAKTDQPPLFLILDDINDPHNLGSIMRTADAVGAHGIIIPKRRAVGLTSVVAKTSTGAIEYMPVARVTNLVNTVKELKDRGLWIFGTDMKGTDYRHFDAKGPVGIIIGNEGKGISPLLKKISGRNADHSDGRPRSELECQCGSKPSNVSSLSISKPALGE